MASFAIKMQLDGLQSALRSIEGLKQGVRNRILRPAMQEGSKLVLQAARQMVPVDSGMLKKSLAVRIQTYRRTGVVVAVVGPRTGFSGRGAKRKRTAFGRKIQETGRNPSKYAHLVEFGHVQVRGGTVIGQTPAHPFLRPAMEATRAAATEAISRRIGEEIEKQAAKGALK